MSLEHNQRSKEVSQRACFKGGCYVLSRKALSKLVKTVNENPKKYFWPDQAGEDLEMGKALSHSAIFVNTLDELHQMRFFTVNMEEHTYKNRPDYWYTQRMYYEVPQGGLRCCSDVGISFHYTNSKSKYLLEFLIYRNHPFGLEKNLTEVLPRKLSLMEIIDASDARRPILNRQYIINNLTDQHNLESSEIF